MSFFKRIRVLEFFNDLNQFVYSTVDGLNCSDGRVELRGF